MTKEKQTRAQKLDAVHEEIVAYLDGELNDEQTQRVEERLVQHADYQRRLQQMQHAWKMLDSLPQAQVDESFSHSTVEMAVVAAEEEWQQAQGSTNGNARKFFLSGIGLALLSTAAGFFVTFWWVAPGNKMWLQDLPVIENVDLYLHADSLDFLQMLHDEKIFREEGSSHAG